jgi:guanylate kinase
MAMLQNGVHYHYVTKEQFEADIAESKFLEYAHVHGNIYGTSWAAVQDVADSGKVCVLDIDVQGARSVRKAGAQAIFVFIAPPSLEELERRLVGRGTETKEQVDRRLAAARGEIQALNEKGLFDYLLVNDDLEMAYKQLRNIAERALQGELPDGNYTAQHIATGLAGSGCTHQPGSLMMQVAQRAPPAAAPSHLQAQH